MPNTGFLAFEYNFFLVQNRRVELMFLCREHREGQRRGGKMPTQTIEGEIMTDFQFKALMAMVLEIMDRSQDLPDARKAISKLVGDFEKTSKEEKED